jgi:UDP-N-acetylglucosamine:LPS N-acetylglucosamine transferase
MSEGWQHVSYLGRNVGRGAAGAGPGGDRTVDGRGRIAIISASIGAGHDGAAAELARRATRSGHTVERFDLLDLVPARLGPLVRDGYHRLLTLAPWGYQRIHDAAERAGGGGPAVRSLLRCAESRVLRALPPDVRAVVSTYPGASQVLGALRRDGRLEVPVVTYLTDFSVHPLWVAPGVDLHLAAHAVTAAQARARGAARVAVAGPVAGPGFRPARTGERAAARARFGLPERGPLALLVAGSWGVGPVRRVAAEILDSGAAVPVVVCGRNRALAERLRSSGVAHAFGWVEDMPALMRAADVLVQNAGGLTSLEAFATGLPVASYRCIPGHGPTNAAALDEAGVAVWIRDHTDLGPTLTDLLDGPLGRRQRSTALALFAAPGRGPDAEISRACDGAGGRPRPAGPVPRLRGPVRQSCAAGPGTAAGPDPAGRPVRAVPARSAARSGAAPEDVRPGHPAWARRPVVRRVLVTAVAASAVWGAALGTGFAADHHREPHLLRTIDRVVDRGLDPDAHRSAPPPEGPRR